MSPEQRSRRRSTLGLGLGVGGILAVIGITAADVKDPAFRAGLLEIISKLGPLAATAVAGGWLMRLLPSMFRELVERYDATLATFSREQAAERDLCRSAFQHQHEALTTQAASLERLAQHVEALAEQAREDRAQDRAHRDDAVMILKTAITAQAQGRAGGAAPA